MCHSIYGKPGLPRMGSNSQGDKKKHMLANEMLALPYRWLTQIRIFSGNKSHPEKDLQFKFF